LLKPWVLHSVVLCKDLMNRSMHNVISTDASISHFTTNKKRKENLNTRDSGYRVFSSWKTCLKSPSFLSQSHRADCRFIQSHRADCRFMYRFFRAKFCDNFLSPPSNSCRFFFFFSIPFFAVTLHRLLCM